MSKLTYFPFGDAFDIRMGTSVFTDKDSLAEMDEDHYVHEITEKRRLLHDDHDYYFKANEGTETAQWDVMDKVLTDLAKFYPQHFTLEKENNDWHWTNKLLNEEQSFVFGDASTLPLQPLDWAGRQAQEDLVILSNDNRAALVAGQLCFPNGWCLADKFDQPFLSIHAPAPKMVEPTMQTAQKLMEKIMEKKPVWRCSWNFKLSGALDLSSKHTADHNACLKEVGPQLNADTIGNKIYIRIERQTVSRLPRSCCILFGIHMYQNTLNDENMTKQQAQNMLNVIETTPKEMLDYKAITPFKNALVEYLQNIISA